LNCKPICTRLGLTIGRLEKLTLKDKTDILGSSVDRAARICSFGRKNQVVVDATLKAVVESELKKYPDLVFSKGRHASLKGIGDVELFEMTTGSMGFSGP